MIFSDVALARRLERVEARSNTELVETRARVQPESGAAWIEVAERPKILVIPTTIDSAALS